jgi:hypothetical protein
LPDEDYSRLVDQPAERAERIFIWTAAIGGFAIIGLAVLSALPFWYKNTDEDEAKTESSQSLEKMPPSQHSI